MADAWLALGDGVDPLSNAAGLPLARTTKLIIDPLVVRPVQNPHLARTLLAAEAAAELTERIAAAGDDLRAAAAWFVRMKQQRRARGITEGNPQEKYFQRAYELARRQGAPDERADEIAGDEVDDVHSDARIGAADLRSYLADPGVAEAVAGAIARAWAAAPDDAVAGAGAPDDAIAELLDACAAGEGRLDEIAAAGAGSAAGLRLAVTGAARSAGLSDLDRPAPPAVGATASKNALPKPFDRSILERLFVAIATLDVVTTGELRDLVERQAERSALPWQIGGEPGRVVLAAGARAAAMDDETDASRRLRARWQREAFVRRAQRLGTGAADGAAAAFVRRLWVRLHGRELRDQPIAAGDVWDLLDGAMRSVVLDYRDRVKTEMTAA